MVYFLHYNYIYASVLNYVLFHYIFNKYTLHVLCIHFSLYDCAEWNKTINSSSKDTLPEGESG